MLAQGIVLSSLLLAGSAFADQVQARNVTTVGATAVTEAANATVTVFTSINATQAFNVTEGVPAATAVTTIIAPANTSTACFCSIAFTANVTEAQALTVNGSTPTTIAVAAEATSQAVAVAATAFSANVTEAQVLSVNGSTPTTIKVAAEATSQAAAVAVTATVCPCQPIATAQAVNQTAQPVGVPTTQSVGAETQGVDKNQVLNANSGVMEIISIQVAGVFTFIGLVGASVTFL